MDVVELPGLPEPPVGVARLQPGKAGRQDDRDVSASVPPGRATTLPNHCWLGPGLSLVAGTKRACPPISTTPPWWSPAAAITAT